MQYVLKLIINFIISIELFNLIKVFDLRIRQGRIGDFFSS